MKIPTSHAELEAALSDLLIEGVPARPFVCEGSPFNCEVAIVGINPGSKTPFCDFWLTEDGFDRAGWIKAFNGNLANRRKTTRPRIERLVRALATVRVVELNAYPYITAKERELVARLRDSQIFRLMLQVARPKLMFVFGESPAIEICKLAAIPLIKREFLRCAVLQTVRSRSSTNRISHAAGVSLAWTNWPRRCSITSLTQRHNL